MGVVGVLWSDGLHQVRLVQYPHLIGVGEDTVVGFTRVPVGGRRIVLLGVVLRLVRAATGTAAGGGALVHLGPEGEGRGVA